MASVSGTGSLGNTSLRGYGGLVSGIDRDQVIEQLTAATNAKITNKKSEMTKLSWKQEAFQSISNKILALQDNFMSYSSSSNLKDASIFAKNRISIDVYKRQGWSLTWSGKATACQGTIINRTEPLKMPGCSLPMNWDGSPRTKKLRTIFR